MHIIILTYILVRSPVQFCSIPKKEGGGKRSKRIQIRTGMHVYKSARMWRKCCSIILALMETVNDGNPGELQCTGTRCYRNLQRLCQTFQRWCENIRARRWCRNVLESMIYICMCNYNNIKYYIYCNIFVGRTLGKMLRHVTIGTIL